jgi:hypothetical protein
MSRRLFPLLAISILPASLLSAGCWSPVAPDPVVGFVEPAEAGYALTIHSIEPPAGATIDRRQGSTLVDVRVTYEQRAGTRPVRLWTCLGRTPGTFIYSSCRDTTAFQAIGLAIGSAGIGYINDSPGVRDTRYVLVFLVQGADLVTRLRLHEDEIFLSRLTPNVVASRQVEHPLSWR